MKKVFKVDGMTCNSCAHVIESKLKGRVTKVDVSFSKGEVDVDFESNRVSEKEIIDMIEDDGEFSVVESDRKVEKKGSGDKIGFWFMIGALLVLAYFVYGWVSDL